ncbi:MAG TPA: anti-sigma factor antagonist [Caldithrix abyssi]|uniref:Anti-sigma factor antagonist n=1 Tax=Caldithrix abyssi TaxID=187145 RepID=A0A7V1LQW5_CALAY|nr:anti-sigma factor antagonist [Caldithrix abyssi]
MEGIQVSTEVSGGRNHISIIKVGGYIDTTTSSELERALNSLLKQGRFFIIVDLGNVDYISSAGWGIFISEIKSIRENGGDLKLVRMVPDVYEIFELLEFHHILDVYDKVEDAVNKFESSEAAGEPVAKEISLPKADEPVEEVAAAPRPATEPVTSDVVETTQQISLNDMTLQDKIKNIVKENPEFGSLKIKRELNTARYGFTRIGWFAVRSELAKLKLNKRNKRYEFATSA